jgi:hypothetical protein
MSMSGTAGNDFIMGTVGNDVISGLGGDDFIDGALGDDTLNGGDGADRGGSVCLNSSGAFPKWVSALVRPPSGLMAAR